MSPEECYQSEMNQHGFYQDPAQHYAVEALQRLHTSLAESQVSPPGFISRLLRTRRGIPGIYLWGGVGRGKTWLMDMFYETLGPISRQRVHYHKFMLDIHEQLKYLPKSPDPLITIGKKIAAQTRVLCLDEFHVTDVTDAMLLAGLLRTLFKHGVTLVATSNISIDDLYRNGLQRERFMEAIALLKDNTVEIHLADGRDYRLAHLELADTYMVINGLSRRDWLEKRFNSLAPTRVIYEEELIVYGRPIHTIARSDDVVWFDFNGICNTPRAAKDYLYLSREFHTIIVSDIPVMGDADDSAAKRFMHLIDALYDHRVKLIVTADAPPDGLYHGRLLSGSFERTVSRLIEMGSHDYLAMPHKT